MPANELAQRRLNALVDRYVTTDLPLLAIVETAPDAENPTVRALRYLLECLIGRRMAKEAIEAAQVVPIHHSDPELLILLLASWAELACRIGRPSDAEALIHRAKALFTDRTHPEVRAAAIQVEGILADTTGNKAGRERIMREILQAIPSHSPRRKFYVWDLAMFLAQQGRGVECRSEIKELSWQCNERFGIGRVLMVQFIDAIETGRVKDASHLMPEIATSSAASREMPRVPYREYQALLRLMHDAADGKPPPTTESLADLPTWVQVVGLLLTDAGQDALRLARREASRTLNSIFGAGFDSCNLVRAELATGSWEGARHVISLRQARGNRHYLDAFFLARAELRGGNQAAASRHFADLLKTIQYFGAKGRLDFELRLATELSRGDIVQLSQAAEKLARRPEKSLPQRHAAAAQPSAPAPAAAADEPAPAAAMDDIIGRSPPIRDVRDAITRFARLDAPVLITGETGTGKELVARALHQASDHRDRPFTPVNCGSIAEALLESEMFGHEKGAFTGADKASKGLFDETGQGTIFLDEIGDISPRLQSALLRVLETGEIRAVGSARTRSIHCRVIAATNADLDAMSEQGKFRRDLLYRIQRLCIHVPPLRERRDDILLLARHFLDLGRRIGVHAALSRDLVETLRAYDWPGNVRELRNVIERMRLMHSDKLYYAIEDLDLKFHAFGAAVRRESESPAPARPVETPPSPAAAAPPLPTDASPLDQGPAATESPALEAILLSGRSQVRRLDRLRALFRQHRKLMRSEVIQVLDVSPNTATKDLKALCDEGFIDRVEPSASSRSHYFVLRDTAPGAASPPPA